MRKLEIASSIQHQTSNIKHQTSNIKHQTSNIKHQKKMARAVHKPNSVPDPDYSGSGDDHSSVDASCPASLATYPGTRAGNPRTFLYLVLHRVGFTKLPQSPGELVRSYRHHFTLTSGTLNSEA